VVVPQSNPSRSEKTLTAVDRDFSPGTASSLSGDLSGSLDESTALSSLKELIAAGDHRLEAMLEIITDAARQLTGASGAALAMWKDGAMVCRARSGDSAPALGARLSADTGISGECLRTGKVQHCADTELDPRVDVEVCHSLGLRSIAVLPIQGWRGINGILEVFSTQPAAFTEPHLAVLRQLASLAEAGALVATARRIVRRSEACVCAGETANLGSAPGVGSGWGLGSGFPRTAIPAVRIGRRRAGGGRASCLGDLVGVARSG